MTESFIFALMSLARNTLLLKRIAIGISFLIVSLILWNTYSFFKLFKTEERTKMEVVALASREFAVNQNLNDNFNVESKVIESNKNIPLILTDDKNVILDYRNLDATKAKDSIYLKNQLKIMQSQNEPIVIPIGKNHHQLLYYRNSDLLRKLTYYPLALILILGLFLSVIYMMFRSNKVAEQNKLWTGMAKETAHQIGTPLSSLLGWIEILKAENVNEKYISEIEKDVIRLTTIANRFSKIGSLPELKKSNIVEIAKTTFNYLESRSSKQIQFEFISSSDEIYTLINLELFGWVLENLIKNAIDAIQGSGLISLKIDEEPNKIKIDLTDNGKGIAKPQFKQIFKPGFTTKKRGWGLGLSLSKRIVEDYHEGKIFVEKSEIGTGTTFRILLNKET